MIPYDFDYYRPETLEEAIELFIKLKANGKKSMYFGGGTEFITMSRVNNIYTDAIIDIKKIPECSILEINGDELIIGSGVSLTKVSESNLFPLLGQTVKRIADHTVQDKLTIGGNLMGTIIYRESSLPLLVSDSHIVVGNSTGISTVPFNQYWNEDRESKKEDLLIQLIVDKKYLNLPYSHVKRTKNEKIDYPLITAVALKEDGDINIAFSGICDTSFRSSEIEKILNTSSEALKYRIDKIINQIPYEILDDHIGTSEYRKFMIEKVIEGIVEKLEEK